MNTRCQRVLVAVLVGIVALVAQPVHAGVQDFTISSFTADYYLTRNDKNVSQLRVVEEIVAEFPGFDQNHGILRAIPEIYQDHEVDLAVIGVTDAAGKAVPFSKSSEGDNLVLKIGDAGKYVHGQQTYVIEYHMQNVTAHFDDHNEFYWDVNGTEWQQLIGKVTARLHLPSDIAAQLQNDHACFTGIAGGSEAACSFATTPQPNSTVITVNANRSLRGGETLTMVVGFNAATFAKYTPDPAKIAWMIAGIAVFGVLPPLAALWYIVQRWRKFGRDPKGRGTIVPEYIPLKDLSVIGSGGLLKESFAPGSISAQIIDLAVRHYIKAYGQAKRCVNR